MVQIVASHTDNSYLIGGGEGQERIWVWHWWLRC